MVDKLLGKLLSRKHGVKQQKEALEAIFDAAMERS